MCDTNGLSGATIADQLYDGGLSALPIAEPQAQGPISSQIVSGVTSTPLQGLGTEVACLISLVGL